jgi:DNA-binding PadR family transcriptional regulator
MLEMAILGVLKEKPMHGYELRHYLSFIVGHIWQLSYGTLYPALQRLEKRGELACTSVKEAKGPAKKVYAVTEQGHQKFIELLENITNSTEISDSHKFNLRLVFFKFLSPAGRQQLLQQRLAFLNENKKSLEEMSTIPSRALDEYRRALLGFHAEANEQEIRFVEKLLSQEDFVPGVLPHFFNSQPSKTF